MAYPPPLVGGPGETPGTQLEARNGKGRLGIALNQVKLPRGAQLET